MVRAERTSEGYEDTLIHLVRRPFDILAGWVIVGFLAAGIALGSWHYPPAGSSPGPTLVRGDTKIDPFDRPLLQINATQPVDEFGIALTRAD